MCESVWRCLYARLISSQPALTVDQFSIHPWHITHIISSGSLSSRWRGKRWSQCQQSSNMAHHLFAAQDAFWAPCPVCNPEQIFFGSTPHTQQCCQFSFGSNMTSGIFSARQTRSVQYRHNVKLVIWVTIIWCNNGHHQNFTTRVSVMRSMMCEGSPTRPWCVSDEVWGVVRGADTSRSFLCYVYQRFWLNIYLCVCAPEASKLVMSYVAAVCGKGQEVNKVKEQLLQSNPVLEGEWPPFTHELCPTLGARLSQVHVQSLESVLIGRQHFSK